MASSPCDCWTHLSDSFSPSSSLPSSSSSSSIEHVWNDIRLASLSNSPLALDLNKNNSSSDSSFLNQPPSTSSSVLHKHSLLSVSVSAAAATITSHHQDQRHMRMIKNRESAVRSRARKQAYMKGLELEIARLTQENSRLRRQLKEVSLFFSFIFSSVITSLHWILTISVT
ncbi:hypothetical protein VNO78_00287 [Psophocarpus tetragonolobus]|uniref:BZIP domain-containing protein n=1 Tax=Psophocarpus tetragonolobus TaxID=3891 RepID=A0AAN9SWX1_PSOTE